MYANILQKIEEYKTIVIHRHVHPDLDAIGSQLGLRGIIQNNFSGKSVYVVGDNSDVNFLGEMDDVEDSIFENALSIVLDVAGSSRVSDERFHNAQETMVIDHHKNGTDFADHFFSDSKQIATCQILTDMCIREELSIDSDTATYLYAGLVTDSGRFLYPLTNALTFECAAYLYNNGARVQEIYDALYDEDINFKKLKGHFINNFKTTDQNVAYMKNVPELGKRFNVSTFTISRGMVNQMSGIHGIPAWVNFTEDDDGLIYVEIRSKKIPVVDIARKYGGGGHDLACGCTLSKWEDTDALLHDLDQLIERNQDNG